MYNSACNYFAEPAECEIRRARGNISSELALEQTPSTHLTFLFPDFSSPFSSSYISHRLFPSAFQLFKHSPPPPPQTSPKPSRFQIAGKQAKPPQLDLTRDSSPPPPLLPTSEIPLPPTYNPAHDYTHTRRAKLFIARFRRSLARSRRNRRSLSLLRTNFLPWEVAVAADSPGNAGK